jgi:hypothetical protein
MASKELLEEAFKKTMEENNPALQDVLISDFMAHLGTMSLILLIRHLMEEAKTPEVKEAYRAIPDQILSMWVRSREEAISDSDSYLKMFSENEKSSFLLSKEELEICAKKLAEEERRKFDATMVTLRGIVAKIKGQL